MPALRLVQSLPTDNGSNDNTVEALLTLDPSILAGDLLVFRVLERGTTKTNSRSHDGGQSWQNTTVSNGVNTLSTQLHWCVWNGTGGPIGFLSNTSDGSAFSVIMQAWAPSVNGVWTLTPDQAFALATPTSATTLTITGQTPVAASSLTLAFWDVPAARTWSTLTGGWTYSYQSSLAPSNQIRNTAGSDTSDSCAYLLQSSAAATGNVSNTMSSTGLAAHTAIGTFAEVITPVDVNWSQYTRPLQPTYTRL